jgi:ribosomal protein L11 methyltransferase
MWQIELSVPRDAVPDFETALAPLTVALSSEVASGAWRLTGLFPSAPAPATVAAVLDEAARRAGVAAPEVMIAPLPPTDWVGEGLKSLGAVRAGRFVLRGAHLTPTRVPGAVELVIEAGEAFGTGHHATTLGCLIALDRLAKARRFVRPLDMGCGTGVLAMAMARLWHVLVLAADIDPIAVRVARDNFRRNRIAPFVRAVRADGYAAGAIRASAPFDLIVANILARPLMAMAPVLTRHLAPGGVAVLSGLLESQKRAVVNAHRTQGLVLRRRIAINGWHSLILVKPNGGWRGRSTS